MQQIVAGENNHTASLQTIRNRYGTLRQHLHVLQNLNRFVNMMIDGLFDDWNLIQHLADMNVLEGVTNPTNTVLQLDDCRSYVWAEIQTTTQKYTRMDIERIRLGMDNPIIDPKSLLGQLEARIQSAFQTWCTAALDDQD